MLPSSRLLTFMNHQTGFGLNFFEGSRFVHDLALLHAENISGFSYLRDFALLGQLLSSYLKHSETMGIFIDSETPYLRLKLEISSIGQSRTLLLPEAIESIPQTINGYCRLVKMNPFQVEPYTSFVRIENLELGQAISVALLKSFQIDSIALASETSDQSILLHRLPDIQVDKQVRPERVETSVMMNELKPKIQKIFALATTDNQLIQDELLKLGFDYISGQDIELKCNCERARMISGIASLGRSESLDAIFENDQSLEVKCDYCKKRYEITRSEVESFLKDSNS